MKQTRADYLQQLWDTLKRPDYSDAAPEFRPFKGWYLVYDEPAYLGDEGNYIGRNWQDAEKEIRFLCGRSKSA